VLAAAIITGLRLARDPRAGCKTERVIDAVEDGIFLADQIYRKAMLRFGRGISISGGERMGIHESPDTFHELRVGWRSVALRQPPPYVQRAVRLKQAARRM
jgi:hypothetical protein